MRKKTILFVGIALMIGVGLSIIFRNIDFPKVSGQTQPPSYDENFALKTLNVKARAVNENANNNNITDLVDEVFNTFQLVVAADVKSRIIT